MKAIIIPYTPKKWFHETKGGEKEGAKLIRRLRTYVGDIPAGVKMFTDGRPESRKLADSMAAELSGVESLRFVWSNRRMPLQVALGQFGQVVRAMTMMRASGIICIIPAGITASYVESIAELMRLKVPDDILQRADRSIVFMDTAGSGTVRGIAP